jgi:hypothetical protein
MRVRISSRSAGLETSVAFFVSVSTRSFQRSVRV